MHIRCFDIAQDVPIGELSTSRVSKIPNGGSSSAKSAAEVEIPETERETFDKWLRNLWEAKDKDIDRYHKTGFLAENSKQHVQVPLSVKSRMEIPDAFCFFIPAVWAYLVSKLR